MNFFLAFSVFIIKKRYCIHHYYNNRARLITTLSVWIFFSSSFFCICHQFFIQLVYGIKKPTQLKFIVVVSAYSSLRSLLSSIFFCRCFFQFGSDLFSNSFSIHSMHFVQKTEKSLQKIGYISIRLA